MARKSRKNKPVEAEIVSNSPMIYKAAVYARLSKERKETIEMGTIENQINMVKSYVMEQPDMELYDIYVDDDISGTTFDRPAFERMMNDVKKGRINAIVIKDLSRLGRDYIEVGNLLENIYPMLKTRIVAINDNYDSLYNSAGIMIAITNIVNDLYAKDSSKKAYAVKQYQMQKGIPMGTIPYGYKSALDENGERIMIVDDEAAVVVKRIFELYIAGNKQKTIADILNADKIPTPYQHIWRDKPDKLALRPYMRWTVEKIGAILKNDVYIGIHKASMTEQALFRNKKREYKTKENWLIFKDHHTALVSKEDFEKAASMRKHQAVKPKNEREHNYFKGKIYCGVCGSPMSLYTHTCTGCKDAIYYVCGRKHSYGIKGCKSQNIKRSKFYDDVLAAIKKMIFNFIEEDTLVHSLNETSGVKDKKSSLNTLISEKKNLLEKIRKIKFDLYGDFKSGILTESEYIAINKEYTLQMEKTEMEIIEIENKLKCIAESPMDNTAIHSLINKYKHKRKLSQELVDAFIDKIIVYDKQNIEIKFAFEDYFQAALARKEAREAILSE